MMYTATGARAPLSAVRQIVDRLCGGSVEQLLVGMVDGEMLDREDLKSLTRKIGRRGKAKTIRGNQL